ncbi:MAG: hypothetical protein MSH15_03235 [Oscillospiraceae bacterium]|nr:hypothetical protein [Oscillospiraceae bacterium]
MKKFSISESEKYIKNLICVLMIIIMGFLFFESFIHTMRLTNTSEMFEGISYHHDNFIFNAVYMAAVLLISSFIMPKLEKIPVKFFTALLSVTTITLGTIWVISSQASPINDQYCVANAANMAAENNYTFMEDRYFSNYPFQLGMVLFYEIQIRLFSRFCDTIIYTEIINVICLALAYAGLITLIGKLFDNKRMQIFSAIAMMFSVQPVLYTTFVYAVIPGITFTIYALLFEIKYFETESRRKYIFALLSVIFMALAVMVKTNNYIGLVALIVCAAVKFLKRKKIADLVYIAVLAAVSVNILSAVSFLYEKRSGTELGEPVPMTGYIAMGLDDPHSVLGCNAKGWYSNYYTTGNHYNHNYETKKSSEFAVNAIKEKLKYFVSDYAYANDFFYEKNTSQWNEPSFACLWINLIVYRFNGAEPGKLAAKVIETNAGDSWSGLYEYMNVFQMLIYMSAFAGVFVCFKKKDIFCSSLILIVLGGFMYHMIFEGKSQYIMPYFILLTGFSGVGTEVLVSKTSSFINSRKKADEKTAEQ